ncbi:bifunctional glutamate N-acetyltransferase/amino-acid acetyltransferase ArgJ [Botrimarina hoheduenensis]|uniref:Arginine biosynthesis bifunctional protein ArgJ n=1 Tax=Botrimarina hoheduenensis TaxID=2528000 RepID=A0A5C5WFX9_9BACT|nr:bifunctional glutamate N-acetyltransferase/amino-acid acetyltransferase ArgJ [Botrimarina hoheduenensis]TWT48672.1 Arginine biosynthesis bifunctional protein ArgJ [Botrimarina hoheduenensis]
MANSTSATATTEADTPPAKPIGFPPGFRGAAVYSGVKEDKTKLDLSLIVSDRPVVAVGVYTQNLVQAAPVLLDRQRTPTTQARGVVINSGVANACTGAAGLADAKQMTALAAEATGAGPEEFLVLSTGVIGHPLPMQKIAAGVSAAAQKMAAGPEALEAVARGMMTTDTVTKIRSRTIRLGDREISLVGVAKGAAMIGPNMATMLAVVMTDAVLEASDAQAALSEAVVESFNCISVDGHTSTNDTVLLLANGAADGPPLADRDLAAFRATLVEVCEDLAVAIPADGEGATHLITVEVHGARSRDDAVRIGKTIADSPLVKTAIAGADPNWGRIVSAAGYAGVPFDPDRVTLLINGLLVYDKGAPVPFDEATVSDSIANQRDTLLLLILDEGSASARFWTTDLTAEYVRLNADYRT